MKFKTIDTYVEVEVDLSEWNDHELIDEVESRGYVVNNIDKLDRYDWELLLEMVDKQPETVYTRRTREKLLAVYHNK